jgi:hypothetical protein
MRFWINFGSRLPYVRPAVYEMQVDQVGAIYLVSARRIRNRSEYPLEAKG